MFQPVPFGIRACMFRIIHFGASRLCPTFLLPSALGYWITISFYEFFHVLPLSPFRRFDVLQPAKVHSMDMSATTISVGPNGTHISFSSWDAAIGSVQDFDDARTFSVAGFSSPSSGNKASGLVTCWCNLNLTLQGRSCGSGSVWI